MKTIDILKQAKKGKRVSFKLRCIVNDDKVNSRSITQVKDNGCLKVNFLGLGNFIVDPIEVIKIFGGEN